VSGLLDQALFALRSDLDLGLAAFADGVAGLAPGATFCQVKLKQCSIAHTVSRTDFGQHFALSALSFG